MAATNKTLNLQIHSEYTFKLMAVKEGGININTDRDKER